MKIKVVAAGFALIALAGCTSSTDEKEAQSSAPAPSSSSASATFDVSGTLTLYGEISSTNATPAAGEPCFGIQNGLGDANYESITEGAEVSLSDSSGNALGSGTLGAGDLKVVNPPSKRQCVFNFSLSGVQPGAGSYLLFVGGTQVNQSFTEEQLRSGPSLALKSLAYIG